jgi:hypothetical protein
VSQLSDLTSLHGSVLRDYQTACIEEAASRDGYCAAAAWYCCDVDERKRGAARFTDYAIRFISAVAAGGSSFTMVSRRRTKSE